MADRGIPVMAPGRMRLAEYDRQDWVANVEEGVTLEEALKPEFWAHMAAQMKPYDHIEARADKGEWVADLIVLAVGQAYARVALKAKYQLSAEEVPMDKVQKHTVEWKGPQHRFAVVRTSDSMMVKSGFQEKGDAALWAKEHEQVT